VSETAAARDALASYCTGIGIDIGFGGSAITPAAITFDMAHMYCPSLEGHRQHLRGDATKLPFVCDEAFDYVYSSHLIEDFYYDELIAIIIEWRRILVRAGVLILNAPDQKRFLDHCERTGQSINANHKEIDFSLQHFLDRVLVLTGQWALVYQNSKVDPYSWHLVVRKV
jgi:predicted SAM-dependent methyltransferase